MATNKTPLGAHRGLGKADAAYVIERLMDIVARRLAIDPTEIRRRNFIRPEEFPYRNATGSRYDSGDYQKTFESHWEPTERRPRGGGSRRGAFIARSRRVQ